MTLIQRRARVSGIADLWRGLLESKTKIGANPAYFRDVTMYGIFPKL